MDERTARETLLLATVSEVADELRPGRTGGPALLDSRLDRDLGFDSLGRVELLARLEQRFDAALPDRLAIEAETPRDLLRALTGAAAKTAGGPAAARVRLAAADGLDLPEAASTWPAVLDWHTGRHPERVHIHFYQDDGDTAETLTYGELSEAAARLAAGLQARGVEPQDTVAIMLPTGRDYFVAFLGAWLAGAVPVPLYPPFRPTQLEDHLRRQAGILENCRAALLVTTPELVRVKAVLGGLHDVLTPQELASGNAPARPRAEPGAIALLQYTSGSTGAPKGVILSHANLLANVRAMGRAVKVRADDVVVSWLPLYHDMGLIGAWLGSLYHGVPLVLMSPLAFVSRPARWLWAIHRYRGTISAAPNFAYDLCLRRLSDADLAGLDLSSARAVLNGAEAISPAVLRRFLDRFAAFGLRREAVLPVYGLAECSVGLAFPPLGREPPIAAIDRDRFATSGEAVPATDPAAAMEVIGCGVPLPGHEIRVVDIQGRELPERRQGRVQFRGPSATSGYYRNPAATAALFSGDWLDSGDLGYLAGGDIFLTGRAKDMIIKAGRNIYPEALEEAVGAIDGIRGGCVAAFASPDPDGGGDRLVVLAETRAADAARRQALQTETAEAVIGVIGMPPDLVVLAPPNTVLKTSSGKIRRAACRQIYESGSIGRARRPQWRQILGLRLAALRTAAGEAARGAAARLFAARAWTAAVLVALPAWPGIVLLPRPAWRWGLTRGLLRLLALLTGTRMVRGEPPALPAGPVVFVANHCSYLDAFVLTAALPGRPAFVAKAELAAHWTTALPLRRLGCAFVERGDAARSLADARALPAIAAEGRSLVFFPEGTFTRVPGLRPFRMGAFELAAAQNLPLVPVALRGTRSILRAESGFPRPGVIRVEFGPVMMPPAGASAWEAACALRDEARRWLLEHCGEPDLSGDP